MRLCRASFFQKATALLGTCLLSGVGCIAAMAQAVPAAATATRVTSDDGTVAEGPPVKGFFANMASTVAHDSISGWSTTAAPHVAYHFNPAFSVDTGISYYLYVNAVKTTKTGITRLVGHEGAFGDMAFAGHYTYSPSFLDDTVTGALTAPTGDRSLGLSSGVMGWNVNDHVEREVGMFSPDLEMGIGNTSNLVRRAVKKNYTSVGTLASFQGGSSVALPLAMDFELDGYEQLPIGSQTVYTSVVRKKKTKTLLTGTSDADDFGVNASFDMPVGRRMSFSSDYSYSIPLQDATIGFTLSLLVLRPLGH